MSPTMRPMTPSASMRLAGRSSAMQASTGWNTPGRHPESSAHSARNR